MWQLQNKAKNKLTLVYNSLSNSFTCKSQTICDLIRVNIVSLAVDHNLWSDSFIHQSNSPFFVCIHAKCHMNTFRRVSTECFFYEFWSLTSLVAYTQSQFMSGQDRVKYSYAASLSINQIWVEYWGRNFWSLKDDSVFYVKGGNLCFLPIPPASRPFQVNC